MPSTSGLRPPAGERGRPPGRTRRPARSATGSARVDGGPPRPSGRTRRLPRPPPGLRIRGCGASPGGRPAPTPAGASALGREREHRPRGGAPRTVAGRRPAPTCRSATLASGGTRALERRSTCPHRADGTSTAAYRPVNARSRRSGRATEHVAHAADRVDEAPDDRRPPRSGSAASGRGRRPSGSRPRSRSPRRVRGAGRA